MDKKIACTIITHESKRYCQPLFFAQLDVIKKHYYNNIEYYIVDNSSTEQNADLIRSYGFDNVIWHYNRDLPTRFLMCECNEIARQTILKTDFDLQLNWESDIIINPTILKILAMQEGMDIITLPYFIGVHDKFLLIRQSVLDRKEGNIAHYKEVEIPRNMGFLYMTGGFREIIFSAIGFILMKRKVTEQIKWEIAEHNIEGHADLTFGENTANAGFQTYMFCDPTAIQHHYQTPNKYEKKRINR